MNDHSPQQRQATARISADGLIRRKWTVAEIERLTELGVFRDPHGNEERFELIDGEIVPLSPKGIRHEVVKAVVAEFLYDHRPRGVMLIPETTLRLDKHTFVEPDFTVLRRDTGVEGLSGETTLLAIEISESSLAYDLGDKARIYAAFGVSEVWVINARTLQTRVHRNPAPDGYSLINDRPFGEPIAAGNVEGLTLDLSQFGLTPVA